MRKIKVPEDPDHRPTFHPIQVNTLKISRLALNTCLLYPRHRTYFLAYVTDTQPYISYLQLFKMYNRHYTLN